MKRLEFKYYLTVDLKIKEIFSGDSRDKIKEAFKKTLEECDEFADVTIYKTPVDVFIMDFQDLRKYATNVTCEFIDDDDGMIII